MAKLMDMRKEPGEKESSWIPSVYSEGLCLYIGDDECEALGITAAMKVGTEVMIQAKGIVVLASEEVERDGDDKGTDVNLRVQITDMSVEQLGKVRDPSAKLYDQS